MSTQEIISEAKSVTVINDGAFRYPVRTKAMRDWIAAHGSITAANYEAFCAEVDCLGEREVGTPGSQRMIDFCAELLVAGADSVSLC